MRVAVTGGTGFVGRHLTERLVADENEVVAISRSAGDPGTDLPGGDAVEGRSAGVTDREALADAVAGCDAVVHLAGINLERGDQTFDRVHVEGTEAVVAAAESADVDALVLSSYLKARPDCGSAYHETKWAAEELVRDADVPHTVLKVGVTYGAGDHMLSHVSRALATAPVFPRIGLRPREFRPLAVEDLVDVIAATLTDDRLADATVPVVGPETLTVGEAVRRIGAAMGRRVLVLPFPVTGHRALAAVLGRIMETPVVAPTQVRILAEGACEPLPVDVCDPLPEDLAPEQSFTTEQVAGHLGEPRRYGLGDLRW